MLNLNFILVVRGLTREEAKERKEDGGKHGSEPYFPL